MRKGKKEEKKTLILAGKIKNGNIVYRQSIFQVE